MFCIIQGCLPLSWSQWSTYHISIGDVLACAIVIAITVIFVIGSSVLFHTNGFHFGCPRSLTHLILFCLPFALYLSFSPLPLPFFVPFNPPLCFIILSSFSSFPPFLLHFLYFLRYILCKGKKWNSFAYTWVQILKKHIKALSWSKTFSCREA